MYGRNKKCNILVRNLKGRGHLIDRWEDNIKMNPWEIGCEDVDWI
jgi:hypothetical protein